MPSASRSCKRVAAIAILAVGALLAPRSLTAQEERVDSIVESAHNGAQLGSKTIRVLLGHTADALALSGDVFGSVTWGGRRYRGTLQFVPDVGSYAVINHVDLEEYLRGVLPGELGSRDPRDRAALQAQAVAARSYAAARMGEARRLYDVTATVSDQVYGGMSVERPESDAAVRDTRGLVLTWGDRIISAPYHSHGGMLTAGADEVWWKRGGEPFLRPVDDHSPDGGCFCDAGGTKGWERRFSVSALGQLLAEYGRSAGVATSGDVVGMQVSARGASGRVTALELITTVGRVLLRGNDIRMVLRSAGAILPSTSFSLERMGDQIVVRGVGNGHGVGMSQWGAIGRSRAGQDARSILAAYYPGTRLSPLL
jgi:stage II sporulation protein D